jgi:multiple sugar transport system substrate-binding protein
MKRTLAFVSSAFTAASLLLTACSGGAGGTQTPAATLPPAATLGDVATAVPADCGNVTLQFWNPFTGPDGPFMGQMVDAFNAEHPEINVTMTSQGEYYTQLTTAAAADTLPDIAIVHLDQIATQAFRHVLRPIDALVATMDIDSSNFPESVWNGGEVAGQRYSIPLDVHPMTMFYNQDLLTAAGINAAPTNREEFEAAAAAMTADGNNGFDLTGGFPVSQIFQMLLVQFGGSAFNADGTEAAWNSDAGVEAMQWMLDAQKNYSAPGLAVDEELNAFKSGTVGMIWNGIWQTTNVTGEGVEFNGQATAVPQIGPSPAVWAGSHQFTLPAHKTVDPCKDAAAGVFIRYMLDNSVTWAQAGQIPANKAVRESSEFQALGMQAAIAPSIENAVFPPAVPGITDAFGPLDEAVGALMNGTATDIQATLDDAATRAKEILQQNAGTYGTAP